MTNIMAILKKELKRITDDRRMLFSTVLLPGLSIFLIYRFLLGGVIGNIFGIDEDYVYQIHAVNMPASISAQLDANSFNIINITNAEVEQIRYQIQNQNADILMVFPSNFDALVAAFDSETATHPAPIVEIWSNSARAESWEARSIVASILEAHHRSLTHRFDVYTINMATEADMFATVIGFMIPMMFLMFIYTSSMSIATESIAGEKERGTLGGMLVTPASRTHMALGKILGIAVFGLLGAISSMVGMFFSMPVLAGIEAGSLLDFYSISDFALLLGVALSTTLVCVSILSILSAYAKSIKEATSIASYILMVVMIAGFASGLLGRIPTDTIFYIIPIFNSSLSISSVFAFEAVPANILVTIGTNVMFTLICTVILARMFSSEKIVFDK